MGQNESPTISLVERIRAEYTEDPGLCLTITQAARFWGLDPSTCEMLLRQLQESGFLQRGADDRYHSAGQP